MKFELENQQHVSDSDRIELINLILYPLNNLRALSCFGALMLNFYYTL